MNRFLYYSALALISLGSGIGFCMLFAFTSLDSSALVKWLTSLAVFGDELQVCAMFAAILGITAYYIAKPLLKKHILKEKKSR